MAGDVYEFTFNEAGTFDYFCMVHPWMTGKVIVN
jgi:plastocyanin